ncbi:hypothetical protein AcW1_007233 [Taiwanofungus camphoratus]|nr:hypothetical protein AcW2_007700 [Antrodia cinnamomea]KAI0952867.1 hypothetical protein AcW1_007233 [Antrodia cinnamomea]
MHDGRTPCLCVLALSPQPCPPVCPLHIVILVECRSFLLSTAPLLEIPVSMLGTYSLPVHMYLIRYVFAGGDQVKHGLFFLCCVVPAKFQQPPPISALRS